MTRDVEKASFVRFDQFFASKLRSLLFRDNPRILRELIYFIRPMDNPSGLKESHNWADIIPYPISAIIRVYIF